MYVYLVSIQIADLEFCIFISVTTQQPADALAEHSRCDLLRLLLGANALLCYYQPSYFHTLKPIKQLAFSQFPPILLWQDMF